MTWDDTAQAKQEMEKAQHLMAVAKEMHDVAELPGSISSSRDFLRHQNTVQKPDFIGLLMFLVVQ